MNSDTERLFSTRAGITLAILVSAFTPSAAQAAPSSAVSSFEGRARVENANVPAGTPVTAWIADTMVAETRSFILDGESVYSLEIPADIVETEKLEGGRDRDRIGFRVGDHAAEEEGVWQRGTRVWLDLDGKPSTRPPAIARKTR